MPRKTHTASRTVQRAKDEAERRQRAAGRVPVSIRDRNGVETSRWRGRTGTPQESIRAAERRALQRRELGERDTDVFGVSHSPVYRGPGVADSAQALFVAVRFAIADALRAAVARIDPSIPADAEFDTAELDELTDAVIDSAFRTEELGLTDLGDYDDDDEELSFAEVMGRRGQDFALAWMGVESAYWAYDDDPETKARLIEEARSYGREPKIHYDAYGMVRLFKTDGNSARVDDFAIVEGKRAPRLGEPGYSPRKPVLAGARR